MSALCWVSSDDLNLSCCVQQDHRRCVGAILTCVVMIMSTRWFLRKSQTICLLVCCHGNVSLAVSDHGACVVAILIWCVVTVMSALHVRMMFSGKRKEARAKIAQTPKNHDEIRQGMRRKYLCNSSLLFCVSVPLCFMCLLLDQSMLMCKGLRWLAVMYYPEIMRYEIRPIPLNVSLRCPPPL